MAHSSGGGSSGGGCCFSGGGGGTDTSMQRHYSHTRFPASNRYSYLDRNGSTKYIYCIHHPAEYHSTPWILYVILVIFIGLIFRDPECHFFVPQNISSSPAQIVIEDRQNLIEDKEALQKQLSAFYRETGVLPAVETVSQEQWKESQVFFGKYALEEYYRLFDDETHWLIVYSRGPEPEEEYLSAQWQFEGIIGDDAGGSINDAMCRIFTKQTHRNLKKMQDPGEAIGLAFEKLQHKRAHNFLSYNGKAAMAHLIFSASLLLPIFKETRGFYRKYKYRNAVLDE